jgi:hypothetical protein
MQGHVALMSTAEGLVEVHSELAMPKNYELKPPEIAIWSRRLRDVNIGQEVYVFAGRLKGQVCKVAETSTEFWALRSSADPAQNKYNVKTEDIFVL